MKICQINCVYGNGSTGKIVKNIHQVLQSKNIGSIVICPITNQKDPGVYEVSSRLFNGLSAIFRRVTGWQFDGAIIQTWRSLRILEKEKPDVVHLHCINGNNFNVYRIYQYLSAHNIPTLLTLHAEFPYTGGCGHAYDCEKWKNGCGECSIFREATQSWFFDNTARTWRKQRACYDRFKSDRLRITAVSPWLAGRAKEAPMLSRFSITPVLNGVSEIFQYRPNPQLREKYHILPDEKIVLHVATYFNPRTDNLKGGKFILDLAEQLHGEKVKIVVAANSGSPEDLPDNIMYVGRISNQQELAALYSISDVTVITSKRETFCMPLAESLCCGTPVVGFKAGGPESIALEDYCSFTEYGDIDGLARAIQSTLGRSFLHLEISAQARPVYEENLMTASYLEEYQLCMDKEEAKYE